VELDVFACLEFDGQAVKILAWTTNEYSPLPALYSIASLHEQAQTEPAGT
jgi:hypothetical protein